MYYYASGKEELYQEIVFKAVLDNVVAIKGIMKEKTSPVEKIRQFVKTVLRSYEIHYPYLYIYIQENMATIDDTLWTKNVRALARRFNDAVVAIVQEGLHEGVFKSEAGNATLIAYAVIGMCNWTHRWFRLGGPADASQVSDGFCEMILNGLGKESPSRAAT